MSPYEQYRRSIARIYQVVIDEDGEPVTGGIVGTGFLVAERYLLTCAHVVASVLSIDGQSSDIPQGLVYLDFPFSDVRPCAKLQARAVYWLPEDPSQSRVEDIAGLYLIDAPPQGIYPAPMKSIDDLNGESLREHRLQISGFPIPAGQEAHAVISSAPLANRWVQIEDTKETGVSVKEGFSGSPVWDTKLQGVVGMVLAKDAIEPERKVAYMTLRQHLPAFENQRLYVLLDSLSEFGTQVEDDLQKVYQDCHPDSSSVLGAATLWGKLSSLEEMMQGGQIQVSPLLAFVARLSLTLEAREMDDAVETLRQWAREQGEDLTRLQAYVRSSPDQTDLGVPQTTDNEDSNASYLVVVVQADPYDTDSTELSIKAWIITDVNQYDAVTGQGSRRLFPEHKLTTHRPTSGDTEAELAFAQQMSKYLYSFLKQRGRDVKNLILEIFLPLDLLNHPADAWRFLVYGVERVLGSEYPLILRSSERLEYDYEFVRDKWREKWETLMSNYRSANCGAVLTPVPTGARINQILSLAETSVGLRLPDASEAGEGSPIAAVLAKGNPVAVWLRQGFPNRPGHQQELDRVFQGCIHSLPGQVKSARNEALGIGDGRPQHTDDDHVGHHLVLLWEDYDRLPPIAF